MEEGGLYTYDELLEPSSELLNVCDIRFVQQSRLLALEVREDGDYAEASRILENMLAALENVRGCEDIEYMRYLFELACTRKLQDRDDEAVVLLKQLLDTREKVLGLTHPHTLNASTVLADTYTDQGRSEEAAVLLENALPIVTEQTGPTSYKTLITMNNLARAYRNHGRLDEAKPLFEKSLTGLEDSREAHDQNLLNVMENLANLNADLGHYAEAEALFQRNLTIRIQSWGSEHPSTTKLMLSLASFYEANHRISDANVLYQRVLAAREKQLGRQHPDTLKVLAHVVRMSIGDARVEETIPIARGLVSARKANLRDSSDSDYLYNDRMHLEAQQLLAVCYQNAERYVESEELHTTVVSALREEEDDDRSLLLQSLYGIAMLRQDQGRYSESEELLNRALSIGHSENATADTMGLRKCTQGLAQALAKTGRVPEAENLFRELLAGSEIEHGESSLKTASVLVHFGFLYEDLEHWPEASSVMLRALQIREGKLGKDHDACSVPCQAIALCAEMQENYAEAESWYYRSMYGMEKILGCDHKDTVEVMRRLLGVLSALGKTSEEEELLAHCRLQGVYFVKRGVVEGTKNPGEEADDKSPQEVRQAEESKPPITRPKQTVRGLQDAPCASPYHAAKL
ncbi:MAG: hypothetical protein Q9190_000905 [Brigantiaea leucoxantha]